MTHKAMIVAPQPEAAEAGANVLARGGNAMDAAIACAFVQTVVDPLMCGIGGFGSMQVYSPARGKHEMLEFYSAAPYSATPDMWIEKFTKQTDDGFAFLLEDASNEIGYGSICTPGTLKGYGEALSRYGSMGFAELLDDAIRYAGDGWIVRPDVTNFFLKTGEFGARSVVDRLQYSESGRRMFFRPDGGVKRPGDVIVNEDYARTLERIQLANSSDVFYFGDLGQDIAADMAAHGGLITMEDLQRYEVETAEPLWGEYRGHRFSTSPPPGSGISTLELLNIMENFDLSQVEHSSIEHLRILVEAMKRMTIDKGRYMGDPKYVDVPVDKLTSKEFAAEYAEAIRAGERAKVVRAERPHPRETTTVSVIDGEGTIVILTHSLGQPSGVISEGLGFLYNGAMSRFDPRPGHAASLAPGKRRASSAAPTIVFTGDKPWFAAGAPGGSHIAPAMAQCVMNVVDFGMTISEAVAAPRTVNVTDTVDVSNRVRHSVTDALEADGYEVRRSAKSFDFAALHGLLIDEDGTVSGGADPGQDGVAYSVG